METKKWWLSKGVWGAIITVLTVLAGYFGVEVDPETQELFVDQAYAAAVAIAGLVGGVLSLIGRLKAEKKVTR